MPIDLSNSQNIVQGWGRAPELQGRDLGHTVAAIMEDRLRREALQQKILAEGIKRYQEQRQGEVYGQAARDAGLLPGISDTSGLTAAEISNLAQRIGEQTPDTQMDAYHTALAGYYNRAGGRGGGGGSGQPGEATGPEFVYDKDGTKYLVVRTSKSVTYHRVPNQSGGGAPKLSPTEKGWAAPEIPGVSVDINNPDAPGTTLQPNVPPMPDAAPQPSPAETGNALPTTKPVPTTGADKNLAPGYGVPAGDRVKVKSPDGQIGTVSAVNLQEALKQGYIVVQ